MSSTSRDALLQELRAMVSIVEESPIDVFHDELRRQKLRSHVKSLKFAVARPLEILFEDICCQVCNLHGLSRRNADEDSLTNPLL